VLWLIVVVSVNDTAAYLAGSRIGGPKLCPAISPGKTVSGSLAGLFFGTCIGTVVGRLSTAPTLGEALVVALCVAFAAQLGDLAKSYLKRLHGVKDSGAILPGHGGLLDRIDGILAGAIVVYVWVGGAW
jgi:phosphatidate cytidylyltransferase